MNTPENDDVALSESQRRQIERAVRYEIMRACVAQRVYSYIESSIGRPLAAAAKIIDAAAGLPNGSAKPESAPPSSPAPPQSTVPVAPEIPDKAMQGALQEAQRVATHTMHQFGFQFGPAVHPLANQLTPELIGQSIDTADKQDERKHFTQRFNVVTVAIVIIALCLIFLGFGKVEFLDKIIALFVGFIGGYGYAKGTAK